MSSNSYGNEPAFPVTPAGEAITETDGQSAETHLHATAQHYGLTKREAAAIAAMQGYCANFQFQDGIVNAGESVGVMRGTSESATLVRRLTATAAVGVADALLAELAKGGAQ